MIKTKAFTLIELLVVVAIIGILAAGGVVAYNKYIWVAKKTEAKMNLNTIYTAEQEYKSNNGEYKYIPGCSKSSTEKIVEELDVTAALIEQDFFYCTSGNASNDTLIIEAYHSAKGCRMKLNEKNKLTPC